jgi:hypothetical protein
MREEVMTHFYKIFALIAVVLLLVITVNTVMINAETETPPSLYDLLTELQAKNMRVSFEFAAPLMANVRSIDVNGEVFTVGEDYVCFHERWNQGTRQRCTPFSNIASVTFAD